MNRFVFDLEFDSLTPTKIHVLSYAYNDNGDWKIVSTNDTERIKSFFLQKEAILIGHNVIKFDIPAVERLLDIKLDESLYIIDTLALSWYLYPDMKKHGLSEFGKLFGKEKIEITDWENLSYEEYKNRCEVDVEINIMLWGNICQDFDFLYEAVDYTDVILRISFKMKCLHLAEKEGWRVDIDSVNKFLEEMQFEQDACYADLKNIMPVVPVHSKLKRPINFYNNNGQLSKAGLNYLECYYGKGNVPVSEYMKDTAVESDKLDGDMRYVVKYEEPNPNSTIQIKNWLFSLGWKPDKFKFELKGGEKHFIPQILNDDKSLTDSVVQLAEYRPEVKYLEKITVLKARIGTLKGFIKNAVNGKITATASGLTNTLRLKHSIVVNLPKTKALYGKYIRKCLIADEGYELVEADIKSLENTTRNHFIYELDKDYVDAMNRPDFDSHLDLAVKAKMMTEAEVEFYKWYKDKK